jgi:hypothetical protein
MKRLMFTLSSLALVSAACGGRVNLRNNVEGDDAEGAASSGGRGSTPGGGRSAERPRNGHLGY